MNPWFAELNFSSAQATMRRLDKAFRAFFRRLRAGEKPGYPRFKVAGRYDSMEFPAYGDGIGLQEKLRIQHVGQVKVKRHRGMEGAIKTVTWSRKVCDNASMSAPAEWRCIATSMRQGTSLPWPRLGQQNQMWVLTRMF